ncbi:MAG: prepilin-type N-terminal cleavage/methylation domain-containing protein [Planctomycetota bacterium]
MPRQHPRQTGFTLVELMISIGLLSLLLLLISTLFNETSAAVSTSVRSSALIAGSRSIGTQMDDDFKNMLGPESEIDDPTGGYIVIINHRITNSGNGVAFPFSRNGSEYFQPSIRSDQIVFVRNGVGVRSMTPLNRNQYGSTLAAENTPVLVRYGHAQRTERDGTPRTGADTALGQANAGLDRVATDFILGRSQLLMNPPGLVTGTHVFAGTYAVQSRVTNSDYSGTTAQYLGLTDVTASPYSGPANGAFPALRPVLNTNTPLQADRNTQYLSTSNAINRMQVNPAPTGTNFEAWATAQTHGILQPNCSEFIVQFAADLDGNGRVDTFDPANPTVDNNDIGGAIRWYDGFNTNFDDNPSAGALQEWDQPAQPSGAPSDANYPYQPYTPAAAITGGLPVNATHVFIFRDRDDAGRTLAVPPTGASPAEANSNWPYMIRIRYRLHDTRGRVTSNDPWALADGIDNDGDGIIDAVNGDVDEDRISGRWFEHIYRVPRPGVTP